MNKLKRMGTSRRVRNGFTMRKLELWLGEDLDKIVGWIKNGWLRDRLQGTRRVPRMAMISWIGTHADYDKIDVKTVRYGHQTD
ncbi:MAG: hypothetical protein WAR24_01810 [Candidatus Acidiferrales bacterium]